MAEGLGALVIILMLLFYWALLSRIGDMAERRGLRRFTWQLLALLTNPFGMMVFLWLFISLKEPEA